MWSEQLNDDPRVVSSSRTAAVRLRFQGSPDVAPEPPGGRFSPTSPSNSKLGSAWRIILKLDDYVKRADELIKQADGVLKTSRDSSFGTPYVEDGPFGGFRAASLSFLRSVYGADHPYYTDFAQRCDDVATDKTRVGREILVAVFGKLKGGWIATTRGLVSAEIFSDFLEMAAHLLSEKYKDAAAVIAGSVLEEHLRQLCTKHGIPVTFQKGADVIPKKADALNSDLANATVYNRLDQKSVTTWLDLRNKAAHGKYGEYTEPQVALMHQGILDFMTRNSV